MSWETTATYGAICPLWFGRGDEPIAQIAESVAQHGKDHTGDFTQVRAAARRKTLLLLWWIDGGWWWKSAALLPDKVALGREWLCAYECTRVRILYMDQGVTAMANQSLSID